MNNHASAIANGWMALRTNAPGSAEFAQDLGALWTQYRPATASFPGSMNVSTIKWLRGYGNLKPKALGSFRNPFSGLIEKYRLHFYGDDQYGIRWEGNASVNKNTPWDNIGAPVYGLSQRMNIYTALGRRAATAGSISGVRVTYLWSNSRPGTQAHENDKQAWTLNAQVEMDAFKAGVDAYSAAFKAREDALAAEAAAQAARRQAEQEGMARLVARVSNQGKPLDVAFNKVVIKTPTLLMPSVEQTPSAVLDLIGGEFKPVTDDLLVGGVPLIGGGSDGSVLPEPTQPSEPEPVEGSAKSKPPIALIAAAAIGGYFLLKG